jgi:hypothetical protein
MSGAKPDAGKQDKLPISPPTRKRSERDRADGAPDLHIEEIEEKHIPKDRNIFDK